MKRYPSVTFVAVACLCIAAPLKASDLYKWTDENGNLHVATSLADVPERYHDQVATIGAEPSPEPAPSSETARDPDPSPPAIDLHRFEIAYENEGSTKRVIIPVMFNDRVSAPMAIDTGSPGMVISFDLAQRIGAFSRDGGILFTEASGIGGATLAIRTIVDSVSVESARTEFVPTTVTGELSEKFDGLIGLDFLANHTISIDSRNQVVIFQETPARPGARGGHDESWWRETFEDFRAVRDLWDDLARTTNLHEGSPYRNVIESQAREAERLFLKLDRFASDHAVPRHWR